MQNRNNLNNRISYIFFGFLAGLILLTIIYIILFYITKEHFTFHQISIFHRSSAILYLLDLLPLYGISIAYYFFLKESKIREELNTLIRTGNSINDKAVQYLHNLQSGRFTEKISSEEQEKELFISLDNLRNTLLKNKEEEEIRKREDYQRNWISEGLARFGELLRQPGENMEEYSYILISNLVKYLEANQGGFFSIETDEKSEKYLQMMACYAYDRRKFADKRIEWGTGLTGTCALEKKTIYMTDIPEDYLLITSGLGKANPQYLLLVPLLSSEDIHGVIEIASFRKIETYQTAFVEKVAESIAMTISGIKNNIRTARLLKETRAQAEELAIQEERVRQNMEELKATQEQAARQAEKFISFTNSVNHTLIRAEYDTEGILIYANTRFLKKMGYSGNREVEGKHISTFIHEKDMEWFNNLWLRLAKGGQHFEGYMKHITRQGQDLWTMATYTCVRKDDGMVEKILFLALDTTEQKKQSIDYESQIEALNNLSLKAEFSPDGKIINWNDLFINTMKHPSREMENKTVFDFIDRKDIETFNEIWESVIRGNIFQGQVRLLTKYDEEKWFRAAYTAVNDMYNEVAKVIFIANEITNEKLMESETRKQTEKLKIQEETLRLTGIELTRKINELELKWSEKLRVAQENLNIIEDILDSGNDLILSVDNSGFLVFINKPACKYWNLDKKLVLGLPASQLFDINKDTYPDFFINLIDPAKSKIQDNRKLRLPGSGNKNDYFASALLRFESDGKIIYTAIFTKLD